MSYIIGSQRVDYTIIDIKCITDRHRDITATCIHLIATERALGMLVLKTGESSSHHSKHQLPIGTHLPQEPWKGAVCEAGESLLSALIPRGRKCSQACHRKKPPSSRWRGNAGLLPNLPCLSTSIPSTTANLKVSYPLTLPPSNLPLSIHPFLSGENTHALACFQKRLQGCYFKGLWSNRCLPIWLPVWNSISQHVFIP